MVKGFDTTTSDPSKLLLDSIFSFMDSSQITISPEKAIAHIMQWLESSTLTSGAYKKFETLATKPSIVIHNQCPKPLFLSSTPYEGDAHFGAFSQ
jgi:hypothetical protein